MAQEIPTFIIIIIIIIIAVSTYKTKNSKHLQRQITVIYTTGRGLAVPSQELEEPSLLSAILSSHSANPHFIPWRLLYDWSIFMRQREVLIHAVGGRRLRMRNDVDVVDSDRV